MEQVTEAELERGELHGRWLQVQTAARRPIRLANHTNDFSHFRQRAQGRHGDGGGSKKDSSHASRIANATLRRSLISPVNVPVPVPVPEKTQWVAFGRCALAHAGCFEATPKSEEESGRSGTGTGTFTGTFERGRT